MTAFLQKLRQILSIFGYGWQAIGLVWQTSVPYTIWFALLTLITGMLPAGIAYLGKLIVDGALVASKTFTELSHSGDMSLLQQFLSLELSSQLVLVFFAEAMLVILLMLSQRGISIIQSLFRGLLGHKVNMMILEKAQTLSLSQFEDSEFYDKLVRARREASTRPLGLVTKTFGLLQNTIGLVGFGVLLVQFSPWVIILLMIAALPGFVAETFFSNKAFSLFRWRSPEARQQNYLETLVAREDNVKEVKLFGLEKLLTSRYAAIFNTLYREHRKLTIRRDSWGLVMDVFASVVFYGAFAWVIVSTVIGQTSIGEMTMYLIVFKQGQAAIKASLSAISGMYEDNLYLSNLYEFIEQPGLEKAGSALVGAVPNDGIRFEHVTFYYDIYDACENAGDTPVRSLPALSNVSFHIAPGASLAIVGENGSGKTTLIKLLTRLYSPTSGRILLDGTDLQEWDSSALHQQMGVIFQDFIRYQLTVGENIGVGCVDQIGDEQRWQEAAEKGRADKFIESLPARYQAQLGRWFKSGIELSGGQWQKMALARAFMRKNARILILDEPTAAMDAQAEAEIFNEFNENMVDKITILISHRFSTVRTANSIIVMDKGCVLEMGSHQQLVAQKGVYARLFALQAKGYQ